MATQRGRLRNLLEAALALTVCAPLLVLPQRLAQAVLAAWGSVGFVVLPRRRRRAIARIRQTLGLDQREARRVAHGSFRNLVRNVLEAGFVARRLRRAGPAEIAIIEGGEHLRSALARGEGVLLATAHLGAWEAMGPILAAAFRRVWAVARPLDNPLLERFALRLRGEVLAGTLEKDGSALRMARLLRDGQVVALLLDQNAGSSGVTLPFLGLPSRQHRSAGVLGQRFGATVLCAYLLRERGDRPYRLVIEAPLRAPPGLADDAAERALVLAVSRSLERQVLAHPEQWNWLHDRWFSAEVALYRERQARPPAESGGAARVAGGTNGG